jgi:DNA polymerase-1
MYFEHGFEADDLMATLSQLARDAHMPCRLLSIDKDLCQLVSDQTPPTQLFDPYKLRLYNEAGVHDRMGVPPSHIIDFQALVGDSTDNVPGVAGVGPKTAIALINAFGHLEDIYNQLDQVETLTVRGAKSLAKKLEKSREDAFMSRELVALRKDVPMPLNADNLATSLTWNGTTEEAEHFFGKLGLYYPRRRWERLSYR